MSRKSRTSVSEAATAVGRHKEAFTEEIHRQFKDTHSGPKAHAALDSTRTSTGVIWVTERANEAGFGEHPEEWANLGQGAPEVEDIEGCLPRPTSIPVDDVGKEYGSTAGIKPLREAVANLYNHFHRQGRKSQYTWENVAIVPGGRAGLTRIAAVLGNQYMGFFIPDYTAYNEMLGLFRAFTPIPIPLNKEDGWHIHPEKIAEELARGTGIILTSNPRNPTGEVVTNPALAEIQEMCRGRATLVVDEFYGGYNYMTDCDGSVISAAENVDDVNEDDLIIIDGLTKRFRLPGFRIAWLIGPKSFVNALGSCGSYLDGGANVPFQQAAVPLLRPDRVLTEMQALQRHFKKKRDFVINRLREIGFPNQPSPDATFYIWLDLSDLPESINDGLTFFEACLKEKVTLVPGIFFDLNPAKRRDLAHSPCQQYARLSYGPKMEVLTMGLDAIERVVKKAKAEAGL